MILKVIPIFAAFLSSLCIFDLDVSDLAWLNSLAEHELAIVFNWNASSFRICLSCLSWISLSLVASLELMIWWRFNRFCFTADWRTRTARILNWMMVIPTTTARTMTFNIPKWINGRKVLSYSFKMQQWLELMSSIIRYLGPKIKGIGIFKMAPDKMAIAQITLDCLFVNWGLKACRFSCNAQRL